MAKRSVKPSVGFVDGFDGWFAFIPGSFWKGSAKRGLRRGRTPKMVPIAIVTVESEALIRRPNLTLATVDRYLSGMADIPSFEYCILTGISLPDGKRYGPKAVPRKLTKAQRYASKGWRK